VTAEPTRRIMLAAVAAGSVVLAGCKGLAALGPIPKIAPDVLTLERAITAEDALVARYGSAITQLSALRAPHAGGLVAVVTAIHAEHQAHARQLRQRLTLPPRLAKTRLPTGPGQPPPLPTSGAAGILGALAADERAAAVRLTAELLPAPPALAQLMASISASEAAHVVYLRRALQPGST
jgi:outer membrane murein-binding lipoprotein Lpp